MWRLQGRLLQGLVWAVAGFVIGAVLVAGWFVLDAINHPRETTGQYLRGEADLRKLIE